MRVRSVSRSHYTQCRQLVAQKRIRRNLSHPFHHWAATKSYWILFYYTFNQSTRVFVWVYLQLRINTHFTTTAVTRFLIFSFHLFFPLLCMPDLFLPRGECCTYHLANVFSAAKYQKTIEWNILLLQMQ